METTSGVVIEKIDDGNVRFKFTNGSLIVTIRKGDLSLETCDAIVNPTNESMSHNGGLDTIIHKTMGQYFTDQVLAISKELKRNACPVGQSRIFIAKFNRESNVARFVINTVGPDYEKEGAERAAFHLQSCYYTSLALANLYSLSSIAYPAISCGAFKYPPHEAAQVSIESIRQFSYHVQDVRFVLYDGKMFDVFVHEWTEYSQKINKDANVIDERPRSSTIPSSPITPSTRYCVLCKEKNLPADRQFLCVQCSTLSRSEIFNNALQRLRSAADKSLDDLKKECRLFAPILPSYPLLYTPALTFDQSIHKRDSAAEYYLQTHCDKKFRRAMPMAILGDGNCFYNTFVKLAGAGTTTEAFTVTPVELRARNVIELVLNIDEYKKEYQALVGLLDAFEKYVIEEMVHDTNYAAVWDFFSIATVLNVKVISVYPKVNGADDLYYQKLNDVTFEPLPKTNSQSKPATPTIMMALPDVKILFSHCNKPGLSKKENWSPNHFVPLLNLR